jgi:hypothetical protein
MAATGTSVWTILALILAIVAMMLSALTLVICLLPRRKQEEQPPQPLLLYELLRQFRDADFRKWRLYIVRELKRDYPLARLGEHPYDHLPAGVVSVSSFFDDVGLLVATRAIPEEPLLAHMGGSLNACWRGLEEYILTERRHRPTGTYLAFYEHLVALYRKKYGIRGAKTAECLQSAYDLKTLIHSDDIQPN